MKENLARHYFDLSLDEIRRTYKAGEFDDNRERRGKVISLTMLLPEYWEE